MQPHQERVIAERAELDQRLGKLLKFLDTDLFFVLDPAEQARMHRQAQLMSGYSDVLGERIAAFTP
jgi:hypothetical protein